MTKKRTKSRTAVIIYPRSYQIVSDVIVTYLDKHNNL